MIARRSTRAAAAAATAAIGAGAEASTRKRSASSGASTAKKTATKAAAKAKVAKATSAEPKAKKARAATTTDAPVAPDAAVPVEAAGLVVGAAAPAFCIKNHDEEDVSLAGLAGKKVVIYFYPRDDTPGCTAEGKRFTQLHDEFAALNTVVLGVSADKVASHKKFRSKYGFPFALLADTNRDMIRAYGAVKEGTKIQRSTVVIDENGHVVRHWATVRGAAQHPDEVLEFIRSMA